MLVHQKLLDIQIPCDTSTILWACFTPYPPKGLSSVPHVKNR